MPRLVRQGWLACQEKSQFILLEQAEFDDLSTWKDDVVTLF